MGAEDDGLGHVRAVFPQDLSVEQGACVRGMTAARLCGVPERVFITTDEGRPVSLDDALREMANLLGAGRPRASVLVDLNRPLEGVLGMGALCRATGADFAPFAPPQDLPFVRAGLTACPDFAGLADCDLVIAVGDPFSTHPAVARRVRDMQFGERGNKLLSVDTAEGRTGRGADTALAVGPQKLAGFLAALAIECGAESVAQALDGMTAGHIADKLALDRAQVEQVAEALKKAKAPGIVVSNTPGRYAHPEAVVGIAGQLGAALDCGVWPLLSSTNSALLPWLRGEMGAVEPGALMGEGGGASGILLVVGCDPAAVLPERLWRGLCEGTRVVCFAASLGGPFAEAANVVLPLALPWEEQGTVLAPSGERVDCPAWMPRPDGLPDAAELANRMAAAAGLDMDIPEVPSGDAPTKPDVSELVGCEILEVSGPAEGEAVLVGSPEPQGATGLIPLSDASWQRRLVAEEAAFLDAGLAQSAGLAPEGVVKLDGEAQAAVPYEVKKGMPGTVAVPAHWGAARELISWRTEEGGLEAAPAKVRIEKDD